MAPMPAHVVLTHHTDYVYDRPVQLGPQLVRLRPMPDLRAPAPGFDLRVEPAPLSLHWLQDPWGNAVGRLIPGGPTDRLALTVRLTLDMAARNPFDFLVEPAAVTWPFHYDVASADALAPFLRADQAGPLLQAMRLELAAPQDTVGMVIALAAATRDRIAYVVRMEAGVWPPERTLQEQRGSCRDSAWLVVQLLRLHGIAARFVSGYLVQATDAGLGAELHAWAEAYLPGAGWIGVDATSGLLCAEGHVAVAGSPGPIGAAPLDGTVEAGEARLTTSIRVVAA